jgi:hypothetical protein
MSFKEEFLSNIVNSQAQRFENAGNRPMIEVWPDDDGDWVVSHENQARRILCVTPEFESAPFCGRGLH